MKPFLFAGLLAAVLFGSEARAWLRHTVHREAGAPGAVLRLHALEETPGNLIAFWAVTAGPEPVVRRAGSAYVIRFELPPGASAGRGSVIVSGSGLHVEELAGPAKAFQVRLETAIAPTVSKRGPLWFVLSAPGL